MKYGIKSITMDDVARELSISKKTLYQFVTDKDDLVGKFIENEIELRQEQIFKCFRIGLNAVEEFTSIKQFIELLKYHVHGIATGKGISVLEKKIKELEINIDK